MSFRRKVSSQGEQKKKKIPQVCDKCIEFRFFDYVCAGTCINMICVHSIAFVLVSMLYMCNDTARNVLGTFHYIIVTITVKSVKVAAFKAL